MPDFKSRLKKSRRTAGFTQVELARLTQTHRASVQRWERGDDLPSAVTILRIADTLKVSVRYLLCRVDSPALWVHLETDERKLIDLYRGLPPHGKIVLVESARDLLQAQRVRPVKES